MANNTDTPLMEFESDVSAPILRYDVPSPSSYEGRNYIELDLKHSDYFDGQDKEEKAYYKPTIDDVLESNKEQIYEYLAGTTKERLAWDVYSLGLRDISAPSGLSVLSVQPRAVRRERRIGGPDGDGGGGGAGSSRAVAIFGFELARKTETARDRGKQESDTLEERYELFRSRIELALEENKYPAFRRTMGGSLELLFLEAPATPEPQLLFIETYRLTSYAGDYGAGTTIKTFSLLPSEETEISIKTWKKETTTSQKASSILDSYTETKADEFEKGVQKERSSASKADKSFSYHAEAEAKASWGWGSAKVSGGVAGGSNASRESMAKNVMNATENHSQEASARREVNIDTSYERSFEESVETALMRKIKNLNASRTLNFVFRQMNQEFHSILHLTDVRVAFYNGYPGSMREFALYELDELADAFMKSDVPALDGNGGTVSATEFLDNIVLNEYGQDKIFDFQGNPQELTEVNTLPDGFHYLRVIPGRQQKYVMREEKTDDEGGVIQQEDARYVDGVILSTRRITMRTDGVIVESLIGKATALDKYALDTQQEVVRSRRLENEQHKAGLDIIDKLLEEKKFIEAADAYRDMFVPPAKPQQ